MFQMHHTDVMPGLERWNAVAKVCASGLFDRVALAAADVPENRALAEWAERWDVELFLGAERDVGRRLLDCADAFSADVLARALVWWFFLDVDLVAAMLGELERGDADYVNLPRDFDVRFGADVFRRRFLERALVDLPEANRQNPWGFAEARPERFAIRTFESVPTYDRAAFEAVARGVAELWPERWDGAATPLHPYRIAAERLADREGGGRALDIACGLGAGTALLAEKGRAIGVDVSPEAVAAARERYGARAEFLAADALALDFPAGEFDLIASVHTMEHVADDRAFLEHLQRWLKPGGVLVLEVPLLAKRPFAGIREPLSPAHAREYDADELVELVGERFAVRETFGVNRGAYLALDRARSAALVVAEPR